MRRFRGLVLVVVALPALAAAQDAPLVISPSGQAPPSISPRGDKPPPTPSPGPAVSEQPAEGEGAFYDYYRDQDPEEQPTHKGPVPEVHQVRSGDTLWGICSYYLGNPWEWPRIWSYNPTITNPHWIFPGDAIRLTSSRKAAPAAQTAPAPATQIQTRPGVLSLRQLAFVSVDDLKIAGTIVGSPEERLLLSSGDEIYIDYVEGNPPQVDQRYAIYGETKKITHPQGGAELGSYVRLKGEVRILEVKKNKKARAVITGSTDAVERGLRVGPVKRQFREIAAKPPKSDVEGIIVGVLETQLIGDRQIVFIDRGSEDGVTVGNQLRIVRRGDAYQTDPGRMSAAGRDDRRFPDDRLGTVLVVEVGRRTSIALVAYARTEAEVGDHVVMRKVSH